MAFTFGTSQRNVGRTKKSAEGDKDKDKSNESGNLQLKSNIKTILTSNLCLSSEDVEKMCVFSLLPYFDWPLYFTNPYSRSRCGL